MSCEEAILLFQIKYEYAAKVAVIARKTSVCRTELL